MTVRDRDTMEQVRMPISELKSYIESKIELKKYTVTQSSPAGALGGAAFLVS